MIERRKDAIFDVFNLVLGTWLFFAPWTFGWVSDSYASWNAWLSGIAIGVVAITAVAAFAEWQEWINVALGIWVAVSAWIFGVVDESAAIRLLIGVGVAVAVIAAVRLCLVRRRHQP